MKQFKLYSQRIYHKTSTNEEKAVSAREGSSYSIVTRLGVMIEPCHLFNPTVDCNRRSAPQYLDTEEVS
jgi:hypothetical protein